MSPAVTLEKHTNRTSESSLLHGNLHQTRINIDKQEGSWQYDGKHKFFDASGGSATACLGYNHKRLNNVPQLNNIGICNDRGLTNSVGEELAEKLLDTTDHRMARVYVTGGGGSLATEAAISLCYQYHAANGEPGRTQFISRWGSYHGHTQCALSLSGHKARREASKLPLGSNVHFLEACDAYRGMKPHESSKQYVLRLANSFRNMILDIGPKRVAAFICEPVVGAALGCAPAVPGYLKAMMAVCEEFGVLFISDEIMCGVGRLGGKLHAWQKEDDFVPHIQTLGKGLGGGRYPISAVMCRAFIAQTLEATEEGEFAYGHTFDVPPDGCAYALEVLNTIEDEKLLENVDIQGKLLRKKLVDRIGDHENVGDIRGEGFFQAIEFVQDKSTKQPFPRSFQTAKILQDEGTKSYGIRFYAGQGSGEDGLSGDFIMLCPAYNITGKDVDYIVDRIGELVEFYFPANSKL